MPIQFIQAFPSRSDTADPPDTSGMALVVPAGGIPVGHTVLVAAWLFRDAGVGSIGAITDDRGNTFNLILNEQHNDNFLALWWCSVTTAMEAADEIGVQFNNFRIKLMLGAEYSGLDLEDPVESSQSVEIDNPVVLLTAAIDFTTVKDRLMISLVGAHQDESASATAVLNAPAGYTLATSQGAHLEDAPSWNNDKIWLSHRLGAFWGAASVTPDYQPSVLMGSTWESIHIHAVLQAEGVLARKMAAIGIATQNAILNEVFKLTNRAPDAALYIGLSKGDPLDDASALTEPSGGSYARVVATAKFTTAAAAGEISNDGAITFPLATGDWGTITHWFLANHLTNGGSAIRWRGPFREAKNVISGDTVAFAIGEITATLE